MSRSGRNSRSKRFGTPKTPEIPREDDGRFAYQGGKGKINTPTTYSGPARSSAVKIKPSLIVGREESIASKEESTSSSRELVVLPKVIAPTALERAYSSYKEVKNKGVKAELKELVLDLENLIQDIVFTPSNALDEEWSIEWCVDPKTAEGNSREIARAIHDTLEYDLEDEDEEEEGIDGQYNPTGWFECIEGWTNSILTVAFEGPVGRDVVCGNIFISPDDGSEWIVDYSARQWDERTPFPLVQPRALWEAWIRKHNEGKIFLSSKIGA